MPSVEVAADGAVATLTINRPDALNALDGEVLDAIKKAVSDLPKSARAIIVTGAGKAFVAGADIQAMAKLKAAEAEEFSRKGHEAFQALADFAGPVVAAVNGYALGGGLELALACDFIVASDRAVLGAPEVGLGVIPGFGATVRLPHRIGIVQAKRLLMTGARLKANEALAIGLVDEVVPGEELAARVRALIDACLANGPLAVARVKHLADETLSKTMEEAINSEAKAFGAAFLTRDQKEGMAAFLEKRKPAFKGE